jgi:hypothetical protein
MNVDYQQTSPTTELRERRYTFTVTSREETYSESAPSDYVPFPRRADLLAPARETLRQTEYGRLAREGEELLSIIENRIRVYQQYRPDLDTLPPVRAFNVEDGSVLIEWTFDDFRIGFTLEPDPEDSGWYLVSTERLGEIAASGSTFHVDIEKLVGWLFGFIGANA